MDANGLVNFACSYQRAITLCSLVDARTRGHMTWEDDISDNHKVCVAGINHEQVANFLSLSRRKRMTEDAIVER